MEELENVIEMKENGKKKELNNKRSGGKGRKEERGSRGVI